jgi:hypothetical protein
MKKLFIWLLVLGAIGGGVYQLNKMNREKALASPQGDPDRAVETFMKAMLDLNKFNRNPEKSAALRADLGALQQKEKEGEKIDEEQADAIMKKHGIEPQSHLFLRRKVGREVVEGLMSIYFDEYSVNKATVLGKRATVYVDMTPILYPPPAPDAPELSEMEKRKRDNALKPVKAALILERRGYRWYITDIEGDFGKLKKSVNVKIIGPG